MRTINQKLTFNSKHYQKILKLLQVGTNTARLIGGCVRDACLSKFNNDIDIATTLLPQQVMDVLSSHNIKVVPTGVKFGTVTAFIEDEKFEITTLRKDLECDGRHAKVEFTDNFEEDALRRDFTINTLSYSLEHKLYDYFNGLEDLQKRRVVFVGNPFDRIKEDYLRILRFFRFSCYYADSLDKEALEACIALKSGLKTLSQERIKLEMDKLIIADSAAEMLLQMHKSQILQTILPIEHFDVKPLQKAMHFAKSLDLSLSYLARYAIIFYKNNIKLHSLLRLKFSRQESQIILNILTVMLDLFQSNRHAELVSASDSQESSRSHFGISSGPAEMLKQVQHDGVGSEKMLNQVQHDIDFILRKIWLDHSDYLQYISVAVGLDKVDIKAATDFIDHYQKKSRPIFPLTGHDLLSIGLQGKEVGKSLEVLRNSWIESDFQLTKAELLKLI